MNKSPFCFSNAAVRIPRARGFTLIESMVVISILAILMALAAPSFASLIAKSRLSSASNDVITSVMRTRNDALQFGRRVTTCRSADGATCIDAAGSWETGWITFVDVTRSGALASVDADETITAVISALPSGIVVKTNGNYAQHFSYKPDGIPTTSAGALAIGTIRVCSPSERLTDTERARDIVISASGRPVSDVPRNATGVQLSVDASCPAPA